MLFIILIKLLATVSYHYLFSLCPSSVSSQIYTPYDPLLYCLSVSICKMCGPSCSSLLPFTSSTYVLSIDTVFLIIAI
nr:MAG TPA: hypothetical protein [Caudoviricetes sp.]